MRKSPILPGKQPAPAAKLDLFATSHSTHRLSRTAVVVDGFVYRLLLAIPVSAPPEGGFPILYLLDGNAAFDLIDAPQLSRAAGLVLAGIAHDTDLRFDPPSRSRDYTPAADGPPLRPDPERPDRLIGGADLFLDRLLGPLRAHAESGLAIDPARRAIFGHSLAGMFGLYTLLTRPGAFSRIAVASPSIWWRDKFMLALERQAPASPLPHDVLVTLGDSERRSSAAGPHWDGPAPHTLEMIGRLDTRNGVSVSSRVFEGLSHAATLPASLPLALEFAAR